MGGKSGPSNNQMVQFQMEQARKAEQKENERQARLNQGKGAIDTMFSNANFDDAFYKKYGDAALEYGMGGLEDQYGQAKNDMQFNLSRAGLLRSTAAGRAQGMLENQRAMNEASIRTKADNDMAALRDSISSQQQQAYNQLYATEDPSVAANMAANAVGNAQLSQPNLAPLGELFKPVVIGLGSAAAPVYGASQAGSYLNPKSPTSSGSVSYTG